jgi:triacylglycerol esterase/lipase EstA (alpha/beta hydrolase family)
LTKSRNILLTHALYPAFKHNIQENTLDADTDFEYPIGNGGLVSDNEQPLSGRKPLILIHGWQGDRGDANYINAFRYENSPEVYFKEFLAFFGDLDNPISQRLREEYKLYLYKYPSFEHITFNGRVLGELILNNKEIYDHISDGGKIDIIGHSMGGLVARSFIEEHGVGFAQLNNAIDLDKDEQGRFETLFTGEYAVSRLITLATPHHGSPGAGSHWADLGDFIKDRRTPGGLDLMWDDFDGGLSSNINDTAKMQSSLFCYADFLTNDNCYYYFPERAGLESFDKAYNGWEFETTFDEDRMYRHPNPWLRALNAKYHTTVSEIDYVLYGGSSPDDQFGDSSAVYGILLFTGGLPLVSYFDRINDIPVTEMERLGNGSFGEAWGIIFDESGYFLNDSVVPTRSAFLDITGQWSEDTSNVSTIMDGIESFNTLTYKSDITPTGRGFNKYRYFQDYDHDKLRGGAGNTAFNKWSGISSYDEGENWKDSSDTPAYQYLNAYLEEMGTYFVGDEPEDPVQRLSNEPLFLAIAEDLGVALPQKAEQEQKTLFVEDFEDGTYADSMNRWNAQTYWTDGVYDGGVPSSGKYLFTDDRLNYGLYYSSKIGFEYAQGKISFSTDMQAGSANFNDQRFAHLFVAPNTESNRDWFIALTMYGSDHGSYPSGNEPKPNQVHAAIRYIDEFGTEQIERISGKSVSNGNAWNNAEIVIREDLKVSFYMNGILFYTSENSVTGDYNGSAAIKVGGRKSNYDNVTVESLGSVASTEFYDQFTDRNYTTHLAWTAQNNDDRPGTIDMSNGYANFIRTGVGGNGGGVGIDINTDILVTPDTTVRFNVLANSRSVGNGCGWTCSEYPANVRLYVEDAHGNEHIVQYSYNYGGAIQDRSESQYTTLAFDVPQGTWVSNLEYKIRDAWPQAAKITRVYLFAAGWDFNGGIDNIRIFEEGNPIVKSFEDFLLMEVNVNNLENDMPGSIAGDIPAGYRLADWNDLITYSNEGNDLEALWNNIGQSNLMLTRNGDPTAADNIYYNGNRFHRFYFATWSYRPGQTPHSGFASHGNIGQMYLGSWSPRGHVLLIKE